jgi:hypothetical protein
LLQFKLRRFVVILFTAGHIFGFVAPLLVLIEDCIERTTAKVRPVSRVGAGEKSPAVVGRFVEPVSRPDGAGKPVPYFFRALALSTGDLVRMGTNALLVIKDESPGALVHGCHATRAVDILAASVLHLIDAVLSEAESNRLGVLKQFTTLTADSMG